MTLTHRNNKVIVIKEGKRTFNICFPRKQTKLIRRGKYCISINTFMNMFSVSYPLIVEFVRMNLSFIS